MARLRHEQTVIPPAQPRRDVDVQRVLEYLYRYGIRLCSGGYHVPVRTLANPIAR